MKDINSGIFSSIILNVILKPKYKATIYFMVKVKHVSGNILFFGRLEFNI